MFRCLSVCLSALMLLSVYLPTGRGGALLEHISFVFFSFTLKSSHLIGSLSTEDIQSD